MVYFMLMNILAQPLLTVLMMQALIREEDTIVFDNEQCAFGATGVDQFGTALVCKPSTWVTNFPRLAKALNRRCSNLSEPDRNKWHRHCCVLANTVNRKEIWRHVERHPPKIVSTILQCVRDHLRETHQISWLDAGQHVDEPDEWDIAPEYYQEVYDPVTNVQLDPVLVARGREEEMELLKDIDAYEYDTVAN